MQARIEADAIILPQKPNLDLQAQATILLDWLQKGEYFRYVQSGCQVSIQDQLLTLLPKIGDQTLKNQIQEALKQSVKPN